MVESFGNKDSILFEIDWATKQPATAADATRGTLRLWSHGQPIWPTEDTGQGLEWTWIELAEFLTRNWPYLLWENGLPLELPGGTISKAMAALQDRWQHLSMIVRETEEEDLYSFEERHDLARALAGAAAPSVWVFREGDICWISTRAHAVMVPFDETRKILEAVTNAIIRRLDNMRDGRATAARDAWAARNTVNPSTLISIATGLEPGVLAQLQDDDDVLSFWELDVAPKAITELVAVARLAAPLPTTDTAAILRAVRSTPRKATSDLDDLARLATQQMPSDAESYPYDQGYLVADWLRAELGLAPSVSVDPQELLERWHVQLASLTLGTAAVDAIAAWGPRHGPTIIINDSGAHNRSRQGRRATLAHELGHLLLDRSAALPLAEVMGGRAVGNAEERARAFAAQLLLPKEEAGQALEASIDPIRSIDALVKRFGVSREIVAWQARNSDIQLPSSVRAVLRGFVSQPWRF